MPEKSDKLLILDVDETLIHATEEKLNRPEDFRVGNYFVYKRPHLQRFLTNSAVHFALGIWSSAGDGYLEQILERIRPVKVDFDFTWSGSRCSMSIGRNSLDICGDPVAEKRLAKLRKKGYQMEKMLIVEDTPENARVNYGNAIYVKAFTGDPADNELEELYDYLLTLRDVENVRTIEKRHWRKRKAKTST